MTRMVLALLLLASFGCAVTSRSVSSTVPPDPNVVRAIQILDVLSHSIDGAANAKPPMLDHDEASDVTSVVVATKRLLQTKGSCAHGVLLTALTQLEGLPFASKLRPHLIAARAMVLDGFWLVCPAIASRSGHSGRGLSG